MTAKSHQGKVDSRWRAAQKRRHIASSGLICMGIEELGIAPHNVQSSTELQVDHIVPLHEGGGEHGPVRIVCKTCNTEYRNWSYSKKTKSEREKPPRLVPFVRGPLADLD